MSGTRITFRQKHMNIFSQFTLTEQAPGPNHKQYRGFINWAQGEIHLGDPDWIEECAFNNGRFRRVWINIREISIFSYCEGDLTLMVFNGRVSFYKGLAKLADFYVKH